MPILIDLRDKPDPARADSAEGLLRARPGVAVLARSQGDGFEAVLVGATGDLRRFVLSRIQGNDGPRADLASVTDYVLACELGSGFEADWAQAVLSARLTPTAAKRPAWGGVFLAFDPESDVPVGRVIDSGEAVGLDPALVIGPFGRRGAAEAFCRLLDDRFELCREPGLLARRPNAEACAYKDMGKCPAPCDGSEPMEAYRARARDALTFARQPIDDAIDSARDALDNATASLDFEKAGVLKAEVTALESVRGSAFEWVTTLDRFGVLAVLPSGRAGWARLIEHSGGETRHVMDVNARRAAEVLEEAWERLVPGGLGPRRALTSESVESIGLVCRHLFSSRKTRATFLRLDRATSRAEVLRAIRRAAKVVVDESGASDRIEMGDS